jgi:hypothetical protein
MGPSYETWGDETWGREPGRSDERSSREAGADATGSYAPLMLIILASAWKFLIGIAAVVGPLHPDEKIRADAQKVLERLVGHGRRTNR